MFTPVHTSCRYVFGIASASLLVPFLFHFAVVSKGEGRGRGRWEARREDGFTLVSEFALCLRMPPYFEVFLSLCVR